MAPYLYANLECYVDWEQHITWGYWLHIFDLIKNICMQSNYDAYTDGG